MSTPILGARILVNAAEAVRNMLAARQGSKGLKGALDDAGQSARDLTGKLQGLAAAVGVTLGFGEAIREAAQFETSLAKIQTLLDVGKSGMKLYGGAVDELSRKTGIAAGEVAEGLFQAISSGVAPTRVVGFMDTMTKAALGGFTDLATAVDGTTSVMNVYGLTAGETVKVTDAMFVANKLGKTTFEELSRQMGTLAPTAAALGVGYEEMLSSLGATTKAGLNTATAATSIRQALAAMAKPSSEAAKMAKELGIRFDEGAIKANGFVPYLELLAEKTGGSMGAMTTLFGSVEAANAMLLLTKQQGIKDVVDGLGQMKAGASVTEKAFKDVENTFERRVARIGANFQSVLRRIGLVLIDELGSPLDSVGDKVGSLADRAEETTRKIVKAFKAGFEALEVLFAVYLTGKLGGMLGAFATKLAATGMFGAGAVAAAAPGARPRGPDGRFIPGAAPAASGIASKIGAAAFYIQGGLIAMYGTYKLTQATMEALDVGGYQAAQRKNRQESAVLDLSKVINMPALIQKWGQVGMSGAGAPVRGAETLGEQLPFALRAASARGDVSPFIMRPKLTGTPTEVSSSLADFSKRSGVEIESVEAYRQFEKILLERLARTMTDAPTIESRRRVATHEEMNRTGQGYVDESYVDAGAEQARFVNELSTATRGMGASLEAVMTAAETAAQIRAESDQVFNRTWEQYFDRVEASFAPAVAAVDTFVGGVESFASSLKNQVITLYHKVFDKKKNRGHGVSLAKRGAGEAKHLSAKYRLYVLQTGAGPGIIRPLPENYVNPNVVNGGQDR